VTDKPKRNKRNSRKEPESTERELAWKECWRVENPNLSKRGPERARVVEI